ncbi:MAG: methylated-DNA--[protein]-cysteine S-methyltransferase [Acidobacteriia bacterium]|nr:methylated-DNA--[protein]-cysteine S-methyltransferase [Terriglobia bacterium]
MYRALVRKDPEYDGVFFTGVRTTGIFCRSVCTARKPKRENVVFFAGAREALLAGYRPCRVCHPLDARGAPPEGIKAILDEIEAEPALRLRDAEIRARGVDPVALRRWFKKHHGFTFQSYLRALRVGAAFGRIAHGDRTIDAAFAAGWESTSAFSDAFKRIAGIVPSGARDGALVKVTRIPTLLGPMVAGATAKGICLLEFADRRMLPTQLDRVRRRFGAAILPGTSPFFERLADEVERYFGGALTSFTVPLDAAGTEFQQKVWAMLRTIPYGETRSYGEQARLIGMPDAVRAVARANGDNRIAIVIPCHRVVGADGNLTGYGGGLWRKRWLLEMERGQRTL